MYSKTTSGMRPSEILESWDVLGAFEEWFAIDVYDPSIDMAFRTYVGDRESTLSLMHNSFVIPMDERSKYGRYHRVRKISADDARAFFENGGFIALDPYTVTAAEASKALGVSRARVGQLIAGGELDGRKFGNSWIVFRSSLDELVISRERIGR